MIARPELPLSTLKRAWLDSAAPVVLAYAATVESFTSDNLRGVVETEPDCPAWWGCLMARLVNAGKVIEVGRQTSTRPSANGRKISAWTLRR